MRTTLSPRKYKQLAVESLRNSIRLLSDAISLHNIGSYPSAFQLAVLSMEEFAKAKWVDHVYYTSITNTGLPTEAEEQVWLRALYSHTEKQSAFVGSEYFEYSPKLLAAVSSGALDMQKQAATYVGLPKRGKKVNVNARISLPNAYKQPQSQRMISLVARELRDVHRLIEVHGSSFGIEELNDLITSHEVMPVFAWPYGSGLKSRRFRVTHGLATATKVEKE